MIKVWQTSPMLFDLEARVQDTHVFLRMAAIELRRMAERAPEIDVELHNVAQKLDAEAKDLVAAMPNDGVLAGSSAD